MVIILALSHGFVGMVCMCVHVCDCRKGDRIYHQLRSSGCSLDWDRAVFTMDEVGVGAWHALV